VADIRNSKIVDIVRELKSFSVDVEVVDPRADGEEVFEEYGFHLNKEIGKNYDGVIAAVCHQEYRGLDENYFLSVCNPGSFVLDLKGLFRGQFKTMEYWSL
jgi:UDP-N-acetyl-D-galactosamine dehydrogenase